MEHDMTRARLDKPLQENQLMVNCRKESTFIDIWWEVKM